MQYKDRVRAPSVEADSVCSIAANVNISSDKLILYIVL